MKWFWNEVGGCFCVLFFRYIFDPRFSRPLLMVGDIVLGEFHILSWANENEEVNCCFFPSVFLHVKCLCVCRSVSAGFSRVTCSRAAAAASYGGVGSGSRTSAGASAGLRNPGHTFRIADPQKRGHGFCYPTRSAGVTATSRLTRVTKLSRDANETCWTLVEAWWKRKETNTRGSCEKDVSQCCWIITVSVSSVSAEVCRNWNCVWYILIRKSSNLCVLFVLSFCNNQMPYYEIHLQYIYNCCFFVFLDQYHWNNQKSQ